MNDYSIDMFVSDFELVSDREEKIELLLEIGKRFTEVPKEVATKPFSKSHKVHACESDAYVWVIKNSDNTFYPFFAVENPQGISAKALAVVLSESLSGTTKEAILSTSEEIVFKIFGDSISLSKREGLKGMIRLMKELTKAAIAPNSPPKL